MAKVYIEIRRSNVQILCVIIAGFDFKKIEAKILKFDRDIEVIKEFNIDWPANSHSVSYFRAADSTRYCLIRHCITCRNSSQHTGTVLKS